MTALRLILPIILACACAIVAFNVVPRGVEAEQLLYAQDDPVLLADHQLDRVFNAELAAREIDAALALDDVDLAQSFLDLARDRNVTVEPALLDKVEAASSTMASTRRAARRIRWSGSPARRSPTFSSSATSVMPCARARGWRKAKRPMSSSSGSPPSASWSPRAPMPRLASARRRALASRS